MKALFTPISIVSGLLAGVVAGRIFKLVWGLIDDEDAPDPKHREVVYLKLVGALLIEGAIIRIVRGFVDHGQLKPLGGYVRVLADDDETQRRLLEAFKQAPTASRRARTRSPREALTDHKVQASVRKAAAKRIQREQEPPHRARKVLVGDRSGRRSRSARPPLVSSEVLQVQPRSARRRPRREHCLVGKWMAPIPAHCGPTHGTSTILPRVCRSASCR